MTLTIYVDDIDEAKAGSPSPSPGPSLRPAQAAGNVVPLTAALLRRLGGLVCADGIWTRPELRRQWQEKGAPPCGHPHLDREYYNEQYPPRNPDRANTGDKVCTTCGEDFSPQELRAMGR